MNPLLKRILIIIGVILAVLAIGALILKGVCRRGKWSKNRDRYSERSNCCKCCSSDNDDEDDDDDDEEDGKGSRGKMMKKYDGKREDMPMMKKDKKD
jgi:FtsZ-interacting cell division protein ZipA